jgi:hypothetical protein
MAEVDIERGRPKPRGGGDFDRNVIARILAVGDAGYRKLDLSEGYDPDEERKAEEAFYGKEVLDEIYRKREERKRGIDDAGTEAAP